MDNTKQWCLIGFPDDEGVSNVGGRIGASKGPGAFRGMFEKVNGRHDILSSMEDLENLPFRQSSLKEKHQQAIEILRAKQENYNFSVAIGGGHDYIYCHLKGIKAAFPDKDIGCINIDPHFDMRKPEPKFSSGAPFHVALSEGTIKGEHLVEFGIQPHSNAPSLWDFANQNKVKTITFDELRHNKVTIKFQEALNDLSRNCDLVVISLDLDSVAAPFAPGVSAPAVEGFTPTDILEMMYIAGNNKKVGSLGIYELNPNFDIDNRTAKLAATATYYFCVQKLKKTGHIA